MCLQGKYLEAGGEGGGAETGRAEDRENAASPNVLPQSDVFAIVF